MTLPSSLVLGGAVWNSNSGQLNETVVIEFDLPGSVDVRLEKVLASDILERIKKGILSQDLLTESIVMGLLRDSTAPVQFSCSTR